MKNYNTIFDFNFDENNMFNTQVVITYKEKTDAGSLLINNKQRYTNFTRYFNLKDLCTRYYKKNDEDLLSNETNIQSLFNFLYNELLYRCNMITKNSAPKCIIINNTNTVSHGSLWVFYLASKGILFPSLSIEENVEWVYDTSDFTILKYAPQEFRKYFSKSILDAVDNALLF